MNDFLIIFFQYFLWAICILTLIAMLSHVLHRPLKFLDRILIGNINYASPYILNHEQEFNNALIKNYGVTSLFLAAFDLVFWIKDFNVQVILLMIAFILFLGTIFISRKYKKMLAS